MHSSGFLESAVSSYDYLELRLLHPVFQLGAGGGGGMVMGPAGVMPALAPPLQPSSPPK